MNIVLFGTGGMIGRLIAAGLEKRGHDLTGASRSTGADIADPSRSHGSPPAQGISK